MSFPDALCRAPALSVLGPDTLCVGARHSLALFVRSRRSPCRGPALFRPSLCRGPAFSESEPGALSSLCRCLAVSVSQPGALSLMLAPGALCVGARRSLTRCVGARRSLCPGPALSVSGPGALCVGPRRSLSASASAAPFRGSACHLFRRGMEGVGSVDTDRQRAEFQSSELLHVRTHLLALQAS